MHWLRCSCNNFPTVGKLCSIGRNANPENNYEVIVYECKK